MALGYTKTVYANGVAPALSATNLNKNETALQAVSDWADGLLASTGVPNSAKAVKALGADLAALLTAAGYSLAPATGTASLDNIADGTTYKRILAAIATALNAGTYDAASVSAFGIGSISKIIANLDAGSVGLNGIYATYLGGTAAGWPLPAGTEASMTLLCLAENNAPASLTQLAFCHYGPGHVGKSWIRTSTGGTFNSPSGSYNGWVPLWNGVSDGNGGQPPAAKSNKTSNATIGWFDVVDCASGASVTLPAGGTFEWFVTTYGATYNGAKSGESAGGAMTGTASANLTMYYKRKTA